MQGLGITFAPLSPPVAASANPAIARLQGRVASPRRPLPNVPVLRHAISLDGFPVGTVVPDRKVRIAKESPEVIYGVHVAEDYGGSEDDQYMDGEEYSSDGYSPEAPPYAGLSKSYGYHASASRAVEDLRSTQRAPTIQRPHSMMELSELYARQADDPRAYDSPATESSSSRSSSILSSTSSPITSPSETGSITLPLEYASFKPQLPSQRLAEVRPAIPRSDSHGSRFVEDLTAALPKETTLVRQGTLLSANGEPMRKQRDLNRLLAPGTALKRKPSVVVLEQANSKGKARVELDVVLDTSLVVEGGTLRGKMDVNIKHCPKEVWVSDPKARLVGFEELPSQDTRHVFYHHAAMIDSEDGGRLPHTSSEADDEGFYRGMPGSHSFPFRLHLPVNKGAKGPLKSKMGTVRYIVIGSMKLKAKDGSDRSIAHFYRHIDVYPYLSPGKALASAPEPLLGQISRALFMGGQGKVHLTAKLHRGNWVAGQRCYVDVAVKNETTKKVKTLSFALVRTMTVFHAKRPNEIEEGQADVAEGEKHRKKVAEETLEMGKRGARGEVTAKGSWMGVDKGETVNFSHSIQIPAESLSVSRGRHLEVSYVLKVTLGAGPLSTDVMVELPVQVINFISIDPPPGHSSAEEPDSVAPVHNDRAHPSAQNLRLGEIKNVGGSHGLDRMASMDSLQLADLNAMYRAQSMVRQESSASSESTASSGSRILSAPQQTNHGRGAALVVVENARDRQLKHQMSLECISSAIASATARRMGHQPATSALREVEMAAIDDEDNILPPLSSAEQSHYATPEGVQLDDLEDDASDDDGELRELEYEDESEDEVDAVMRNFALEEVLTRGPSIVVAAPTSPLHLRPPSSHTGRAPLSPPRPVQQTARSRKASLATPYSPIKRSPTAPPPVAPSSAPRRVTTDVPSSPCKTSELPTRVARVARVAVPQVKVRSAIQTPSPDLVDSNNSSPSTEDAHTPPLLTPPSVAVIVGQRKQIHGISSPPRALVTGKAAPGVRMRVDALETRKTVLRAVSGRVEPMVRQPSISSIASSTNAFGSIQRQHGMNVNNFNAPVLRR